MFTRPQVRKTAQFCTFFQATLWPVVQVYWPVPRVGSAESQRGPLPLHTQAQEE